MPINYCHIIDRGTLSPFIVQLVCFVSGLYPTADAFFICLAALLLMSQISVAYGELYEI